ncbi:MAG: hypothetical protein FD156_1078 [Nitrospirae bacterium]|nr:MAG: hypothetical protein FD156_1078 [Nitrospirota bacterium]
MKAKDALIEFDAYLKLKLKDLNKLVAKEAVELMTNFYKEVKSIECAKESSDMLLFQYNANFEDKNKYDLNITRQFIPIPDQSEILQLSLTLTYSSNNEFNEIKSGNMWCESENQMGTFIKDILNHEAYKIAETLTPKEITLTFENAE